MPTTPVFFENKDHIATLVLNRPEVMNAIDDDLPGELAQAVAEADHDSEVHVMVLSGAGKAFCAGYDMDFYAQSASGPGAEITQEMPWDPIQDFAFMKRNTDLFMQIFRSLKPVICKVQGAAVAGGSDIALCADMVVMAEDAEIGYMPARVWGCPTTAMWVYRLGPERAKRMLLTGDKVSGAEAERMGLVLKAVPAGELETEVERLAERMASVPVNQLAMQKMLINQALENMGLASTQTLATLFDGITRHSPEGLAFKARSEEVGWKQAVCERDQGTYDWTENRPINAPR